MLEKDINLAIAFKVKETLEKAGARVVMTRDSDVSLDDQLPNSSSRHLEDLTQRVKIVNLSGAEALISIHANCVVKSSDKKGPIVFYYNSVAKNPTEKEVRAAERGRALAECLQKRLNNLTGYEQHSYKAESLPERGNFFVLHGADCPAVIVETGFISNELDRQLLQDEAHQFEIAARIADGLNDYFLSIFQS